MMEFLYFPEDKSEYIPSILMLLLFIVAAAVTMIIFIKASRNEERKMDHRLQDEKEQRQHDY